MSDDKENQMCGILHWLINGSLEYFFIYSAIGIVSNAHFKILRGYKVYRSSDSREIKRRNMIYLSENLSPVMHNIIVR